MLNPSSYFSREATRARRFKRFLEQEVQERMLDKKFNKDIIAQYIPLKDKELDNFMGLYRPDYKVANSWSTEQMVNYLNDCYKKYKLLPPDKRSLPPLK